MADNPESPDFSPVVDPLVPDTPRVPNWDKIPRFLKEAEQHFRSLTGVVLHGNQLETNARSHLRQVAIDMGADEETAALAADHAIWWHRTGVGFPGGAPPPVEAPPPAPNAPPTPVVEGTAEPTMATVANAATYSASVTMPSPLPDTTADALAAPSSAPVADAPSGTARAGRCADIVAGTILAG